MHNFFSLIYFKRSIIKSERKLCVLSQQIYIKKSSYLMKISLSLLDFLKIILLKTQIQYSNFSIFLYFLPILYKHIKMKATQTSSILTPINTMNQQYIQSNYHHLLHFKNDSQLSKLKHHNLISSHSSHPTTRENRQKVVLQGYIADKLSQERKIKSNELKIFDQLCQSQFSSKRDIGQKNDDKMTPNHHYRQFKNIQRTILKKDYNLLNLARDQENKDIRVLENASSCLLEKENNLMLLPLCLGLVKINGDTHVLNLNNYNLGDRYIIALGAGLKQVKLIEKCYLGANRITDLGLSAIVNNISTDILTLDLCNNKITNVDKRLLEMIIENQYRLQELNLRNNLLKETAVEAILRNVSYSKHLRRLNLSKNKLSFNCLEAIVDMLQKSVGLQELYIGSNYLSVKCAEKIFNQLSNNTVLKVLDYSLNQLGQDQNLSCAKAISNCFRFNKYLHHLDLSFNNINKEATQVIAEGLSINHTLYGIHYQGNYGWINSKGFLICEKLETTLRDSIKQSQIKSYQIIKLREGNSLQSSLYRHVCWICQGWHEQEFKISVPKGLQKVLVYIHFDFEQYEPRLIGVNDLVIKYTTMVPPKRYKFYYSVNGAMLVDSHLPIQNLVLPQTFKYQMNHEVQEFKVEKVNIMSGKPYKIVNQWDQIIIKTQPRVVGLSAKKEKEPWSFAKSVWAKQWKIEDDELLRKCFQRDWGHSKISNIVKNQIDQETVKQNLWSHYKSIKNIYRYFSSWNPVGDIWAITSQPFTQFCQQSKLINKDLPLKILDLTFITTNSMSGVDWKGNYLVPERGLVRFQFMQSIVRLAEQKYKKNSIFDTFAESVESILKYYVQPLASQYDSNKWRTTKYFCQFNDELIKKFRPIFNYVFKKNSKMKVKPGEKPFMCLAEFKSILQRTTLNNYLGQRDIFLSYNQAMMTQVDEVESERFLKMTQIQFIQGLGRCASVLPPDCTLIPGKTQLFMKFQWLVMRLRILCNQDLKNQFADEQSSMFDEKWQ